MLYLRPSFNIFTEIIHNVPVQMFCRIQNIKRSATSNSSKKTHVINSVVAVSFVVVVSSPNVISVDYDDNYDDYDDVLEERTRTMGTVALVEAKTSGEYSRGGRVTRIDRKMTKTTTMTTLMTIAMAAATTRHTRRGKRSVLNAAAGDGFMSGPSSTPLSSPVSSPR